MISSVAQFARTARTNRHAYRPDIDGLRAIAILSVLAFHTFPNFVRGGFVGVDVFFVISGYLITGIVSKNLSAGTFRFRHFYARRIRRIFPALALVMSACLILGWFMLLQGEYTQLGKHVAAASSFSLNFVLWREAGYFDTAAAFKPLLHLWSLAIEEQFYIVWPFLLWMASKRRINLFMLTLTIVALSFVYSVSLTSTNAVAAFYSPISRFWELAIGCALALRASAEADTGDENRLFSANLKSVIGAVFIAAAVTTVRDSAFPGWWALLPTLGAGLLISAGPKAWLNRYVLSHRTLVWIGLVSYPLYLWHWPLLAFARIQSPTPVSAELRVGLVLTSIVLAWLTFRLIERPVRRGGATMALSAASVMVVLCTAGVYTYERAGFPDRFLSRLRPYATYTYSPASNARVAKCWLNASQSYKEFASDCIDDSPEHAARPLALIWGDSFAARLYVGVNDVFAERYRIGQFTRDGCAPLPRPASSPTCLESNRFILEKIRESKPDVVILFANWASYYPTWQTDSAGSRELLSTIAALNQLNVPRILVVGPAPVWDGPLPRLVYEAALRDRSHQVPKRMSLGLNSQYASLESDFGQLLAGQRASYFSVRDLMCNADGCLTHVGDGPDQLVSWDFGHFTAPGATYVARRLLP